MISSHVVKGQGQIVYLHPKCFLLNIYYSLLDGYQFATQVDSRKKMIPIGSHGQGQATGLHLSVVY